MKRRDNEISETEFQTQIIDLARMNGWLIHHCRPARMPSGKYATPIQGDAGFPDLVMARRGIVLLVELKTTTGVISEKQQRWLEAGQGAISVWRPDDWPEIIHALTNQGN